ncbi:MAG: hypothetical protein ACI9XO_003874 [Paraglaciecola sp.]|jgi:uncharacterized protein (DUF2237 family)
MKKLFFSLIIISSSIATISFTFKNNNMTPNAKNVLGTELQACCFEPKTGWYRDGYCNTDARDRGVHVVCAEMTEEFLNYSASCGNNLKRAAPVYNFPGLKPGDKWCLCVDRWKEAMIVGVAPPVVLESTHEKALLTVTLEELKKHELVKN